ncbi:hypothetical protein D2W72_26870 [Burkholderia pseudomallei]|nr:hypothetical protein D2W72_26870 [Burkholderia pseudomallei]
MRGGLERDFEVRVRARGSGLGLRGSGFEAGDSRSKPNAEWPKSAIRFSAFGFRLSAFGFRVSDFEREIDAPARARAPSGSPRGRLQASRGASS